MRVEEGEGMHDPQHYCAALNSAGFLIFSSAIFVIVRFPDGGNRMRRWLKRAFAPLVYA
jgi:hypothetical protein